MYAKNITEKGLPETLVRGFKVIGCGCQTIPEPVMVIDVIPEPVMVIDVIPEPLMVIDVHVHVSLCM